MAQIKIITDSACDIPEYLAQKYNITVLPICVISQDKVYKDRYDIKGRDFLKTINDLSEIPTTSMVPMELIEEEFKKNLEGYDYQVFVTMSSKASGGYNAANIVKQQIEDETGKKSNIIVIDSMNLSMGLGVPVIKMAEKASAGASIDEVLETYNNVSKTMTVYFIVDDLKHLEKGGRIKPGTALVGSLLGIKPILEIKDGLVECIGKERGRQKAIEKLISLALKDCANINSHKIWIANGNSDEACKNVEQTLHTMLNGDNTEIYDLGCVVGTHAGPGVVGIIYNRKGE